MGVILHNERPLAKRAVITAWQQVNGTRTENRFLQNHGTLLNGEIDIGIGYGPIFLRGLSTFARKLFSQRPKNAHLTYRKTA